MSALGAHSSAANDVDADGSGRAARTRWAAAVAVVTVLAAGGAALWLRGEDDGGLTPSAPRNTYSGVPITAEAPEFMLGSLTIRHPGSEIKVLQITPLMSPNVEFLGGFTIWPRDYAANALSVGPGFPSPLIKTRHPLDELVSAAETAFLPAGDTDGQPPPLAVAAGFRLRSGDIGAVNGVQVVYTLDGKTVREVFREAVIVCLKPKTCDGPGGLDDPDFEDRVLRQFGLLKDLGG